MLKRETLRGLGQTTETEPIIMIISSQAVYALPCSTAQRFIILHKSKIFETPPDTHRSNTTGFRFKISDPIKPTQKHKQKKSRHQRIQRERSDLSRACGDESRSPKQSIEKPERERERESDEGGKGDKTRLS